MGKEKETNCYLCNQWQVGSFGTQKQVKAGPPLLLKMNYAKAAFG
jgi:hypothetical protein